MCGSEDSVETEESPVEHAGTNGKVVYGRSKDEEESSSSLRVFSCMGSDVMEDNEDSPETYEEAMQRCRKQVQTKLDEAASSPDLPNDVEPSSLEWWSGGETGAGERADESNSSEDAEKNLAAANKELFDFEERNSVEGLPLSSSPTVELLRDDAREHEENGGD